ncbi:MAG: branched-chain amino acid ABC transporter permease [Chloroflexi bacterium]|nr:branched-chain amino acid ABC transporter permease [Chloroflexota bacterium]
MGRRCLCARRCAPGGSRFIHPGCAGFATVGQIVAQNWVDVTGGPLCVTSIPKPAIFVTISSLPGFYYLMTAAAVLMLLFMHQLIGSRIGRSFKAVRENEVMAESVGINPLKYKMLAFCVGAAGAGCVGTLYAYFIGIVCPTDLALTSTLTLLVILFIGGSGSLRGVVLGAMLVTALPEFLRIGVQWRLLLYGVALLLIINFLPNGLEALFHRRSRT